ncbi:MAG: hypothetical protein KA479_09255 [Saprospiraceae bacterium]|nr:hypothetical protein [Saprospiraceae bacterium]
MKRPIFLIMYFISLSILSIQSTCTKTDMPEDNEPLPTLCDLADDCSDGKLNGLISKWVPIGGTFEGHTIPHDCIEGKCTSISFTFQDDLQYSISSKIVQQSPDSVYFLSNVESGLYFLSNCTCRETTDQYGKKQIEYDGTINMLPNNGQPQYNISVSIYFTGVYFNSSSRDSTFLFFLKQG